MNPSDALPSPATPPSPERAPRLPADDLQVRNWLRLRRELCELQARLVYLKLMLTLGVTR